MLRARTVVAGPWPAPPVAGGKVCKRSPFPYIQKAGCPLNFAASILVSDGEHTAPSSEQDVEVKALRARVRELEALSEQQPATAGLPPLHVLLENAPDSITVMDRGCRLLYVNRTFAPRNLSEVLGTSALQYLPEEYRPAFEQAFERAWQSGEVQQVEVPSLAGYVWETRLVPLVRAGEVYAVMGIGADVTQRRVAEEALHQAQKLEAIGRISAELAHNFNNLLLVILTNLGLCKQRASEELKPRLGEAEHAAQRAAELVRRLMEFALHRTKSRDLQPALLEEIAQRTVAMCRTAFDPRIEIVLDAEGGLPPVLVDSGEIEQVLLNVLLNARDALDSTEVARPRIAVTLDRAQMPETSRARPARPAVRLRVRDNGPGMSEAVRNRVFEPFFTTKEDSRGTGLGLAAVYGTMLDHGGVILCDSQPEAGATFTLLFPTQLEPS